MNERIKELAEQSGLTQYNFWDEQKVFEHFAELVASVERERCANLCEHAGRAGLSAIQCAAAIRGRTE